MVVGIKDVSKLLGIFIMSCCAVFVCTLFLNYNMDLLSIRDQISAGQMTILYDAKVMMGKMISSVSGGCLLATSVVMLFFYIKHYIDAHRKELGILKALGYSSLKIAGGFWVFGLNILAGTAVGFGASFAFMPLFYKVMNEENLLPDMTIRFHMPLLVCLVLLPSLLFAMLSCLYGYFKVDRPALELLSEQLSVKDRQGKKIKKRKNKKEKEEQPFLKELRQSTVRSRKTLAFLIGFASFCFSSMMQMTLSLDEIASELFAGMIFVIGIILSSTTLLLAISTVVGANTKTIAMMRAFGYPLKDCSGAILNGYRPVSYVGFAIGTAYQYGLFRLMMDVIFEGYENIPEYQFDVPAFLIVLAVFIVLYECIMYCYSRRIGQVSVKEIMLE